MTEPLFRTQTEKQRKSTIPNYNKISNLIQKQQQWNSTDINDIIYIILRF